MKHFIQLYLWCNSHLKRIRALIETSLVVLEPGTMATNKECIENLKVGLDGLQDGMNKMELGVTNKIY